MFNVPKYGGMGGGLGGGIAGEKLVGPYGALGGGGSMMAQGSALI